MDIYLTIFVIMSAFDLGFYIAARRGGWGKANFWPMSGFYEYFVRKNETKIHVAWALAVSGIHLHTLRDMSLRRKIPLYLRFVRFLWKEGV